MLDPFFAKWHGIDRTTIDWGPKVDASKCTGCGLCVVTCGEKRNVYGFNPDTKKSLVMAPEHCMVGCDNCATACLWDAITFPHDDAYVKALSKRVTKEQIAKELDNKLKENPALRID